MSSVYFDTYIVARSARGLQPISTLVPQAQHATASAIQKPVP